MEELIDLEKYLPPEKLKRNGLFSLSMLFRDHGTAELKHIPIFIRKELAQLYKNLREFLASPKSVRFHLTGPPGTGKTLFVTLVCRMWVSTKPSRRVLYISYRAQKLSDVFIFQGAKVHWYRGGVKSSQLASVVEAIVDDQDNFGLCVFDGVRNPDKDSDCKPVLQIVNGYTGNSGKFRRNITITSMSFRHRDIDDMSGHMFDSLDSWTWESHVECFNSMLSKNEIPDLLREDIVTLAKNMEEDNDDDDDVDDDAKMVDAAGEDDEYEGFNDSDEEDVEATISEDVHITPDRLLRYFEEKFFYAGGSARFMYGRTTSALKAELEMLFGAVEDWTPFTTNDIPPSDVHAINSLMQQFKSNGRRMAAPVSKFVLMRAYEKCESVMLSAIRGIADSTGNPSLQGWAFELEELDKVKMVLKNQHIINR